jgi:hypothetical protein
LIRILLWLSFAKASRPITGCDREIFAESDCDFESLKPRHPLTSCWLTELAKKHKFLAHYLQNMRTVSMARAAVKIAMVNLVYNLSRLVWLEGKPGPA